MKNLRITLFFLLTLFTFNMAHSKDYDGPLSAGIERFTCGEYSLRGQISRKLNTKVKSKRARFHYFIKLYPKTTREFIVPIVPIEGQDLSVYYSKKYPPNISIKAEVIKEGVGFNAKLRLTHFDKVIREDELMKFTVRKIKDSKCPDSKL